jgi:flavin-dependent dehydrogenase
VGDAAAAFDPLSSQGILTALYTGMRAGQTIDAELAGDPRARADYMSDIRAVTTAYLRNQRHHYRTETRWPDSEFWQRRRLRDSV